MSENPPKQSSNPNRQTRLRSSFLNLFEAYWNSAAAIDASQTNPQDITPVLLMHGLTYACTHAQQLSLQARLIPRRGWLGWQQLLLGYGRELWVLAISMLILGTILYYLSRWRWIHRGLPTPIKSPRLGTHAVLLAYPSYAASQWVLVALGLTSSHAFGILSIIATLGYWLMRPAQPSPDSKMASPSSHWMILASFAIVLGAAGLRSGYEVWRDWSKRQPLQTQTAAPRFVVYSIDQQRRLTNTDLIGHPVLIDVWATWCGPCISSMPHLLELEREMHEQGVRFVSINTEPHLGPGLTEFINQQGWRLEPWIDHGAFRAAFGIALYPSLIILDHHGNIAHFHEGLTSMVTLKKELKVLARAAKRDHHNHSPNNNGHRH